MYKKISYLLTAAFAFGFAACSDQNQVVKDLYDEIDKKPVVKHLEYTLTDADYGTISDAAIIAAGDDETKLALAEAVANTNSLNEFATAGDFVPAIITKAFPALKGTSTVQVTFDYSENLPEYLGTLASAGTYTLSAADYTSVWGEDADVRYLTPAMSPMDKLPAILKTALPEAANGDVVITTYKYSDQEPNLAPGDELTPIDHTMTADDHQMVIDHMKADPAQIVFVNTQYNNEEFYYGFGSRYNNVSFRMSVRMSGGSAQYSAPDTELHALDGDIPAQAKLLWKRLVEKGMPLYMGLKWPTAKVGQELNITLAVYYPNGETNATTNYTLKYKITTAGTSSTPPVFEYISGADALYEVPPIEHTMVKEDYQMVIDHMKADPAQIVFVNTQYNNEEFYYGFGSRYDNVSFRLSYRDDTNYDSGKLSANDTELHALDGDDLARAKLLWKRFIEKGMPLYAGLKWPDAAVGQTYDITVKVYYPDGVTNETVDYTLKYRVTSAGTFTYVSGANALYEAPAATSATASAGALTTRAAGAATRAATSAVISTPVDQKAIYTYNGTDWIPYPDALILNPADYTAMGSNYGNLEPEQAAEMLPQFLVHNVDYFSEGDKKAVVYVRYDGSAKTVADEYIYTNGVWTPTNVPVTMTEQAKYEEGRGWWFDPTVTFTMTAADYQILVTSVLSNPRTSMYTRGSYTNEEWYYGANAYYVNFSFRLLGDTPSSSRQGVPSSVANDTELHALDGDTGAQAALLWKRLEEKGMPQFLAAKYPNARVQVSGIDVAYNVGIAVFYPDGITNTTLYYVMTYKVATAGSPVVAPTFTFVEKKEVSKNELP